MFCEIITYQKNLRNCLFQARIACNFKLRNILPMVYLKTSSFNLTISYFISHLIHHSFYGQSPLQVNEANISAVIIPQNSGLKVNWPSSLTIYIKGWWFPRNTIKNIYSIGWWNITVVSKSNCNRSIIFQQNLKLLSSLWISKKSARIPYVKSN